MVSQTYRYNLHLQVCNFYNIKTIGYSGPDARCLTQTETYSIGLCKIEASLVKFVGSPTARIYCQLKESLNMLKTCYWEVLCKSV